MNHMRVIQYLRSCGLLQRAMSTTSAAGQAHRDALASTLPLLTSLSAMREWRNKARSEGGSVGFVPTMGALHEGHIALVHRSLQENDLTVLSIFVNPTQFAPHEDLSSYPRTLAADLRLLTSISLPAAGRPPSNPQRSASAIFMPSVHDMYPSGVSQTVSQQKGTFVEVQGYGHQMEGRSRPTFFRGVATVCTKLFNAVEPTHAYFGQKDIQQALLLRRLSRDLLLSHPTPENLHIVPTARSEVDGLALSSRNAYLSVAERSVAGTLYAALRAGEREWAAGGGRHGAVKRAMETIETARLAAAEQGVEMKLDYVEMNDPEEFDVVHWDTRVNDGRPVIFSGALRVGRTRLIDNIILGDASGIVR